MAKKKNLKKYYVHVEVTQNGEVLSTQLYPFGKEKVVKLTSDPKAKLSAPFYPLKYDIEILNITKDLVEVELEPDWEGFTTYKGNIEEINRDKSTKFLHLLDKGDVGSFAHNDLRVTVKVEPKVVAKKERIKKIPVNFFKKSKELVFNNGLELRVMTLALVCSSIVFTGVYSGFMDRVDDTPKSFIDLKENYTLAFMDPKHFQTAPEAMQSDLDRENPIRTAYNFYNNYTKMYLGDLKSIPPYLFKNTFKRYKKEINKEQEKIQLYKLKQMDILVSKTSKEYMPLISLPSVKGHSYTEKMKKIKTKMKSLHKTFDRDLKERIKVTNSFYTDKGFKRLKKSSILSTKVGEQVPTNKELTMYKQFDDISRKASYIQQDMKEKLAKTKSSESGSVVISKNLATLSTLNAINFAKLNKKLAYLNASTYRMRPKEPIKEPLIGTISPEQIEKVIVSKKYEIQLCYEAALRRNSKINGTMDWSWKLDTRGAISEIKLEELKYHRR